MSETYHIPVLLHEVIEALHIRPDGVYVDATFGGGGHSRAILAQLGSKGKLIGFDQDMDAAENSIDDSRFLFVHSNFRFVKNFLRYHHIEKIDGLLVDLGVSSHHFEEAERGFSFRFDTSLDMRMNRAATLSAADILNSYTEEALAALFYNFGELRQSRRIARRIVAVRGDTPFLQTTQLVELLRPLCKREHEKQELAQAFQALRIEVNRELEALKTLLLQTTGLLNSGGRLVALTYHSLEDRLVKNFIKSGNIEGNVEKDFYGRTSVPFIAVNRKVIVAGNQEVGNNPRARSAKLRAAERV
ncbi:MAG: 16S rRNA (cytosine(1402)-N(4))-methyltransferase RsmH [Prevotellaceae bacterium]|jgi:16S rRNA (cytosine1402-N4)-methyltransferase|nr:16S rRNA (cytosine(1402)-N(4))-methyltransferase RsmH [Prevotellaceae bacterium]